MGPRSATPTRWSKVRLITIGYKPEMEINAMTFDFSLLSGATVKSPADKTFNLELEDGKLVVTYQVKTTTIPSR